MIDARTLLIILCAVIVIWMCALLHLDRIIPLKKDESDDKDSDYPF